VQRIEDFMDEEDRSEVGFAPQRVTAKDDFALVEEKKAPVAVDGLLAGKAFSELVISTDNSVGVRLLKMMGWKEGQGVGPRLAERARNKAAKQSRWGDEHAEGKTFAPVDVSIDSYTAKDNVHGIGYKGLSSTDFQLDVGKKKRLGAGFGVGAMEDQDVDDVYDDDDVDRSGYDRFAGGPAAAEVSGAAPARHLFKPRSHSAQSTQQQQQQQQHPNHREVMAHLYGSNDPPLRGFRAATVGFEKKMAHRAEQVPVGFNPFHVFATPGPAFTQHSRAPGLPPPGAQLSAKERMSILGETPLPSAASAALDPPKLAPPAVEPTRPARALPPRPTITAKEAMSVGVFRPFKKEPDKEARYLAYLDNLQFDHSHLQPHDREREIDQFHQAAKMYRPQQGALTNRFAAAVDDDANDGSKDGGAAANKAALAAADAKKDPAQQAKLARANAVDLKMFGRLTRETHEWHPASLLCKRFGVPDPYPKSALVGLASGTKKGGLNLFNNMDNAPDAVKRMQSGPPAGFPAFPQHKVAAAIVPPMPRPSVPEADVAPLPPRPEMDIFKAIFSDSDSSSSEDEDEDEEEDGEGSVSNRTHGDGSGAAAAGVATPGPTSALAPMSGISTSLDIRGAPPTAPPPGRPPPTAPPTGPPPGDPRTLTHHQPDHIPPKHTFRKPGATATSALVPTTSTDESDALVGRVLPPPAHHLPPKLTLVHTYSDLTNVPTPTQRPTTAAEDLAAEYAAAPAWSRPPPTTGKAWVEAPATAITAGEGASSREKPKKSKSSKEKKHKHKDKKEKKHKKRSSKSKAGNSHSKLSFYDGDDSVGDDSDDGAGNSAEVSDALLLRKMRAAGGVSLQEMYQVHGKEANVKHLTVVSKARQHPSHRSQQPREQPHPQAQAPQSHLRPEQQVLQPSPAPALHIQPPNNTGGGPPTAASNPSGRKKRPVATDFM
jgi:G patch domain-containing protein 1